MTIPNNPKPRRVMIIGMAGSGKTTLTRELAARLGVSGYHLDSIFYTSAWKPRPADTVAREFAMIAHTDGWVVDGNYRKLSAPLRQRADLILFLDFSRRFCIAQSFKRWLLHISGWQPRSDGLRDEFSYRFLLWVWNWNSLSRPAWISELNALKPKVIIFKNRDEVHAWLASL